MGTFLNSIHLYTDDFQAVSGILEKLSTAHQVRLIARKPTKQWVSIFPEFGRLDLDLGTELSQHLDEAIVHVQVFDDDLFCFRHYRENRLLGEFVTGVEVSDGEVSKQSAEGFARSCRDYLQSADECETLRAILEPRRVTFESQRLEQVARILNLPDVQLTYEELIDEMEEDVARKQTLQHFPSPKSTATKEQAVRDELRTRGLLLGEIPLEKDVDRPWALLPESAVILVARGGTLRKYDIRHAHHEDTLLQFDGEIGGIWASPLGDAVVVYADEALHRISPIDYQVIWSAEIATPDQLAVSANAQLIASATRSEVTLMSGDGNIERTFSCGHVRCLAIHPSSEQVVVASAGPEPTVSIHARRPTSQVTSFQLIDRVQQQAREDMALEEQFAHLHSAGPAIAIILQLEFSPDGTKLVCGIPGGMELLEWEPLLKTPSNFPPSIAYCYPPPPHNERGSSSYFWCAAVAVDWKDSVFLMTGMESQIQQWRMGEKTIDELPTIPYRQRTARMSLAAPQSLLVCEYHDFPHETRKPALLVWDYRALAEETGDYRRQNES